MVSWGSGRVRWGGVACLQMLNVHRTVDVRAVLHLLIQLALREGAQPKARAEPFPSAIPALFGAFVEYVHLMAGAVTQLAHKVGTEALGLKRLAVRASPPYLSSPARTQRSGQRREGQLWTEGQGGEQVWA